MREPHFDLALVFVLFAGVLALAALCVAARAARGLVDLRARNRELESSVLKLRREFAQIARGLARSGAREQRLESHFTHLRERVVGVEARGETPAFDRAIDSARRGAGADRLADEFGLSRGEADLVARLHGRRKRA
jgi:hypothetical protein